MSRKTLTAFSIHHDGRGYIGDGYNGIMPNLALSTEEFRAGAMDAPIDIETGQEKLESGFSVKGNAAEVIKSFAGTNVRLIFRTSLKDAAGIEIPAVYTMEGLVHTIERPELEAGTLGETTVKMTLNYYKERHNGKDLVEIDVENFIRKIDGVDQLAQRRANIGL